MKPAAIISFLSVAVLGGCVYTSCKPVWQFDHLERNARKVTTAAELQAWAANVLVSYPTETSFWASAMGTNFPNKLRGLAPRLGPHVFVHHYDETMLQADMLTYDFASYLRATFAAQFSRFGNILAFTPMWNLFIENINDRANRAPMNGMKWTDYREGYALKCEGMQSLMSRRFTTVMTPFQRMGIQCFKGAELGNDPNVMRASHKWFGIYRMTNQDIKNVEVLVDPWFSAGGIISPPYHISGNEQYWTPVLWW
jgi:hypothetical protein